MQSIRQRLRGKLPFSDLTTSDRQMLLVCIGLAFVFWLILNLSQEYSIQKDVNLTYHVAPERVIAGDPPRNVPVQIEGRGWNLIWESIRGNVLDVEVDLAAESDMLVSSNLLQQQISRRLSSGDLRVESMGFESQRVLTTPRDGKRVPVVSMLKTRFAAGYFSPNGPHTLPDSITVSGSADALENIDNWPTENYTVQGVRDNNATTVPLVPAPAGLTLNYDEVTVIQQVEAFIEQQISVPITLQGATASDSSRVFPAFATVTVTIPQREYGLYKETDFRVEAEVVPLTSKDAHNTLPLTLTRVPESIKSVSFTPRAVEYYVYRRDNL